MQAQEPHSIHQRMLALAEEAEPELVGPRQVEWLARLDAEHENMRAALAWSTRDGHATGSDGPEPSDFGVEAGLRLASSLQPFWERRDHLIEGRAWLEKLLAIAQQLDSEEQDAPSASETSLVEKPRAEVVAKAVNAAARLAYKQADLPTARRLYEEGLQQHTELQDPRGIAAALGGLGHIARAYDDLPVAKAHYEEALRLRKELGDKTGMAGSLFLLGQVARTLGELDYASALVEEAASLDRELGDNEGLAYDLEAAGHIEFLRGRHTEAQALAEEAVALYRSLGEDVNVAEALDTLGLYAMQAGEYTRAAALLEEAAGLARGLEGNKSVLAWPLCRLGIVAARQGELVRARELLVESVGLFMETEPRAVEGIAMCLLGFAGLAGAHRQQEQWARSARLAGAADALNESCDLLSRTYARNELARNKDAARSALGEEAFASAWEEGRGMLLEQAVAYALEETPGR